MLRRLDLPLAGDGSARFLPWIIALMVYLAALALAGTLLLREGIARWDQGLAGSLTVEVPPDQSGKTEAVAAMLRATPGIARAQPLDAAAAAKLLEPWLGTSIAPGELPLPVLIDVRLTDPARVDSGALRQRLAAIAHGAELDDHRAWLDRLFDLALGVEIAAAVILGLIAAATVATIVFTTRTGLAIHHATIEVLHLIGARDGYIAGQFQWQALRLGLRGSLVGLALAVLTLLGLGQLAGAAQSLPGLPPLPSLSLAPQQWAALALPPLVAAATAMATARITVLRRLARMP
jgi:cell division transport system permease protein